MNLANKLIIGGVAAATIWGFTNVKCYDHLDREIIHKTYSSASTAIPATFIAGPAIATYLIKDNNQNQNNSSNYDN